jgi:hypothetical protein
LSEIGLSESSQTLTMPSDLQLGQVINIALDFIKVYAYTYNNKQKR